MTSHQHVHDGNGHLPSPAPALGAFGRILGVVPAAPAAVVADEIEVHPSIMPLSERRERILGLLDDMAISVGRELILAKQQHRGEFLEWVGRELPFGIDKAERLMAITRSFADASPSALDQLPRAWTALYELSRLSPEQLTRSIESGEVRRTMSVEDAREHVARSRSENRESSDESPVSRMAEAHAQSLLRHDISELSEVTKRRIQQWISG